MPEDAATSNGANGIICIQGGVELTPPCGPMDREVLRRTGESVAVLAGAARPGSDYDGASARARAHYEALDADVTIVPDPRDDLGAARAALDRALDLIVLPGGSPGGLLDVLVAVGDGAIGRQVVKRWRGGVGLSGASAGAMVLCAQTATPGSGAGLAPGLGLLPGVAVPHWTRGGERRWPLPDTLLWGLPECGGALIVGGGMVAVGEGTPSVRIDGRWRELPRDTPTPLPSG